MQYDIFYNHEITDGFDLLKVLKPHYYVGDEKSWWWPRFLSLRACNGVELEGSLHEAPDLSLCFATLLGQNTKYEYASLALQRLYEFLFVQLQGNYNFNTQEFMQYEHPNLACLAQPCYSNEILHFVANMQVNVLAMLIKKAGFHQQKSQRIIRIAQNIIHDFTDFTNFSLNVDKDWLLTQKGIGPESASGILNYALRREDMVVDSYTQRLLARLGIVFEGYEEIQSFLTNGLDKARKLYDYEISKAQIMARFHGKIVEYAKKHKLPKARP